MSKIDLLFFLFDHYKFSVIFSDNGILLPKLFWPTVRKNCSSDREKLLKFKTEAKLYTPSTLNIQMKLILLWVWAERAVLGRAKTALKFKYEIEIG